MKYTSPPKSESELLARADELAGKTLKQVADEINLAVPANQQRNKGWTGRLAEIYLVATAANQAEPDFQLIGVEMKTIPVDITGKPRESTYVCTLNLSEIAGSIWETSTVKKKLSRVLWLPIEAMQTIPLAQRRFGSAILWSPAPEQEAILKNDWEEIMELVGTGNLDQVSSSQGCYLQIRPKAANAVSLGKAYSVDGTPAPTLPRGFYLRTSFTRMILGEG